MDFEQLKANLTDVFGELVVLGVAPHVHQSQLIILGTEIEKVCEYLRDTEGFYFDTLSCLTGIDNGIEANTMEVVYHLYSIPYNHSLVLKVIINRAILEVPTVSSVWRTADWHEREAYDMYGITFIGHPDLRRILLPADWVGYPLRKDYEEQDYYHGIKVKY